MFDVKVSREAQFAAAQLVFRQALHSHRLILKCSLGFHSDRCCYLNNKYHFPIHLERTSHSMLPKKSRISVGDYRIISISKSTRRLSNLDTPVNSLETWEFRSNKLHSSDVECSWSFVDGSRGAQWNFNRIAQWRLIKARWLKCQISSFFWFDWRCQRLD